METSRPQPDQDGVADTDTGSGYPEEQPDTANPGHERSDREAGGPEGSDSEDRAPGNPKAPTTDGHGADSGAPSATGNPRAAG